MTVGRACHGKKAHTAEAHAARHRQRLIDNGAAPGALEVYPCRHCSTPTEPRWHVGHTKRRMKWRTR